LRGLAPDDGALRQLAPLRPGFAGASSGMGDLPDSSTSSRSESESGAAGRGR